MKVLGPAIICTLIFVRPLSAELLKPAALPPATMEELARVAVTPMAGEHRERQRPHMAVAALEHAIAAAVVVAPTAAAPPITRGFQAVTDPLPEAAFYFDPADASGAVGPHHVVGAFNNAITVHDRNGNLISRVTTVQFWHDATAPDKFPFDPRVAYDAPSDRWVIVMLGDESGYINGVLFVAISATGDPAGTWRRFRIAVDPTGKLDGDKTHLALTADTIAVTTDIWDPNSPIDTTVFTFPKAAAFAGPGLTVNATPTIFFGSDLVPISSNDTTLRFASAFNEAIYIYDKIPTDPFSGIAYHANIPALPPVYCAQLDFSSAPDCGEPGLQNALARDGAIWAVEQRLARGAIVWKVAGSTATAYLIYDSALAVSYPSIAVNKRGAAFVGYAVMSAAIHPSAAYNYIDPSGTISQTMIHKYGEGVFRRSRWGDFSTTLVDPVDDLSFWTLGLYSNTPTDLWTRWATWWTYVQIAPSAAKSRERAVRH